MKPTPGMWSMLSELIDGEKLPESLNAAIHGLCEGSLTVASCTEDADIDGPMGILVGVTRFDPPITMEDGDTLKFTSEGAKVTGVVVYGAQSLEHAGADDMGDHADVERLEAYAVEINRLRNVIQAACLGGTDLMIERWKQLFPDAPVPTVRGPAVQGVPESDRNDPVSALAIRLLVAAGHISQEKANEAFHIACNCLEDEARRMNVELPWVTRPPREIAAQGLPCYWQWRKKSEAWSLERTFNSEVFATTDDSEVRALYASLPPSVAEPVRLNSCAAGRDGDCIHSLCPQLRDGTGRSCPLVPWDQDEEES